MAGATGFEPVMVESKSTALTAWLCPIEALLSHCCNPAEPVRKEDSTPRQADRSAVFSMGYMNKTSRMSFL